jgi:pyruvate formate lyase activating enzyme
MTADEIAREADKDMVFYRTSGGGVTFSGGEAMCYPGVVREVAERCRANGVGTAVETCGYAEWESFCEVLPYIDLVLFDLKVMDDEKHVLYTRRSNALILDNLRRLASETDVDMTVRIPVVPGVNDAEEDVRALAEFVTELRRIERIHLLPYHAMGAAKYDALGLKYAFEGTEPPSDAHMETLREMFEEYGFAADIGG